MTFTSYTKGFIAAVALSLVLALGFTSLSHAMPFSPDSTEITQSGWHGHGGYRGGNGGHCGW